eukprot:362655-Chlamydomonas_euryale.AAC.4
MAASLRPALELATERRSVLLDGVPPERMDEANAMVGAPAIAALPPPRPPQRSSLPCVAFLRLACHRSA